MFWAFPALILAVGLPSCSGSDRPKAPPPPPTITFEAPGDGHFVHGASVPVRVSAKGVGTISDLKFAAPSALATSAASYDQSAKSATIEAALDVSALPDGPLKLTVEARDDLGGRSSATITITVAQRAPDIRVAAPVAGSTVKGTVAVAASATAQTGASITSLDLLDAPPGLTGDVLPNPDSFSATWDTTQCPEGPTTLRFRAVDSTGLPADFSIAVTVDNVPPGVITAHISAGAPIQGALIDVMALDDATGGVATRHGTSGLLGSGGPTDASGKAVITVATENYVGPVRLVARPAPGATLGYIDPANPPSNISIPTSVTLTSILGEYRSGAAVTVPVTLWSTLADAEVLAYVAGQHRHFPTLHTVAEATAFADTLFANHIQKSPATWSVRGSVPSLLTQGPSQTLTDRTYAAFADVGLNQLAKDVGAAVNLAGVLTAPILLELFQQDIAGDGQLDGLGPAGVQLSTAGRPGLVLDEDFLRSRLATALDEFLASPSNLSGLTRSDLDGAGVFTAISQDVSELFGTKTPTPFDNKGPSVSVSATSGPGTPPVGAGSFVAGSVQITAVATDASGVASLAVRVGSTLLAGQTSAGANGSLTWTGTWASGSVVDGPVTVTAAAVDSRSNPSTASLGLTVDNTAPTITHSAPAAGLTFGDSVPFDVTASDAGSGVASLIHSNYPGLLQSDQDSAIGHWLGTWVLPSPPPADGPVAGAFRGCDQVGNCSDHPIIVTIDRTAPSLSWAATPPVYAADASYVLSVRPSDALSSVRAVFVQSGTTAVQAVRNGDVWNAPLALLPGANPIRVWAEDSSSPANSGRGRGEPWELAASVFHDSQAPSVGLESVRSYVSEQNLRIGTDSGGVALVPVQYQLTGNLVALADGSHVYKSAARLGCGSNPPDPAYLRGPNSQDNVPFLVFGVPLNAAFDSPITSATMTVEAVCPTCTSSTTTDLLVDPSSTSTRALYLAPLCLDVIPWLDQLPANAAVRVTANVRDSAGRVGSATVNLVFHLLGPPLAWFEEEAYQTSGDPKGASAYHLTNGTYSTLFDPVATAFQPEEQVRLTRIVVTNPTAVPVAARFSVTAPSYSFSERWVGYNASTTNLLLFDNYIPGGDCPNMGAWRFSGCSGDWGAELPLSFVPQSFGGATFSSGCGGSRTDARSVWLAPAVDAAPVIQAGPPLVVAYAPSTSVPYDFAVASPLAGDTSAYLLPAASADGPGRLHLYFLRPRATVRPVVEDAVYSVPRGTESAPLRVPLGLDSFSSGTYHVWRWSHFMWDGVTRTCSTGAQYQQYAETRHLSRLASASETLAASVTLNSSALQPRSSTPALAGEATDLGGLVINRSISH